MRTFKRGFHPVAPGLVEHLNGGVARGELFGIGHVFFFFLENFLFFFHPDHPPFVERFQKAKNPFLNRRIVQKMGVDSELGNYSCFAYGKKSCLSRVSVKTCRKQINCPQL
jgi:hypothetical protein